MSDLPKERRRRSKVSEPAEPTDSEREASEAPVSPRPRRDDGGERSMASRAAWVWPLVAGIALGFAAGREAYRFGLSDTRASSESAANPTVGPLAAEAPAKAAYAKEAEFPSKWVKSADLGPAGKVLDGLTEPQKTTVMAALNQRDCECGCAFGTLATCLHKDPNCPRSPQMAKLAADLVKQGKALPEILSAIDAKQKDMAGQKPAAAAPEPPSGPRPVELAMWNPRKGPKAAKVTLVEFSDFQ